MYVRLHAALLLGPLENEANVSGKVASGEPSRAWAVPCLAWAADGMQMVHLDEECGDGPKSPDILAAIAFDWSQARAKGSAEREQIARAHWPHH
jgi:hypothetical protein